jgi:hypothetical protein
MKTLKKECKTSIGKKLKVKKRVKKHKKHHKAKKL